MAVSSHRQGSRGVGCAGSSKHGPHLLREGHIGEEGGGCRLVWCSMVGGSWEDEGVGGNLEGGVEVEEVELQHSTKSTCHVIMSHLLFPHHHWNSA